MLGERGWRKDWERARRDWGGDGMGQSRLGGQRAVGSEMWNLDLAVMLEPSLGPWAAGPVSVSNAALSFETGVKTLT